MFKKNPYNLGEPDSKTEGLIWDYRGEQTVKKRLGRRFEEYFSLRDFDMNINNHSDSEPSPVEQKLLEIYGKPDESIWVPDGAFVTTNTDIFLQMFEHLRMDFVADFKSGMFFLDLFGGHEHFMSQLYLLNGGQRRKEYEQEAEEYVKTGMGFFKSTQSKRVFIGEDVAIPDYFRPYKNTLERI